MVFFRLSISRRSIRRCHALPPNQQAMTSVIQSNVDTRNWGAGVALDQPFPSPVSLTSSQ